MVHKYVISLPGQKDANGFDIIDPEDPNILVELLDKIAKNTEFSSRHSWIWDRMPNQDNSELRNDILCCGL